ncbi:MAG: extracellular solute-binding protein [Armatimonadota bacterium]|nr:extracellular solute-binding protein [Armatimonadota bacterium]
MRSRAVLLVCVFSLALALGVPQSRAAPAWSLAEAAKPYRGVTINAAFLERPGYYAYQKMIPDFEKITGIKVKWETIPYENTHEKEVLDFTAKAGTYDAVLIDLVWVGEFAENGWVVPLERFYNDPRLADPELNLKGFFPILLKGFGSWKGKVYGLPWDNYSGLMFYNRKMLKEAGFNEPPKTWEDLFNVYGPRLTKGGKYAFAQQSRRGETMSCDAFARYQWGLGNGFLDQKTCKPVLDQSAALRALEFQIALKKIMPPDVAEWDHDETVQALAQGKVAMINEWSAFWAYFKDPKTSKIIDDVAVTVEPMWKATGRRVPAFGGFSMGVNAFSSKEKQEAAWLFIQWATSEKNAKTYIINGGVSARMAVYNDPELQKKYPYFKPLVESWKIANPIYRPRFAEWPQISDVVAQYGSEALTGQRKPAEALKLMNERIYKIMEKAGYYTGKKTCEQ